MRSRGVLSSMLLVVATACSLGAPPVATTLAPTATPAATAAIDDLARQALAAAEAAPDDAGLAVAAAQHLFAAADLRLQRATVAWLAAHPEATRAEVLAADDRIDDEVRREIASLCQRGLELADHAAANGHGEVAVRLQQAQHVSLLAWANGATRSLLRGYGPRLVKAIDAAVALDQAFDGAAPLRLSGRFRARAPWPYGDHAAAARWLRTAVELAPLPINHLFYGDLLAATGDDAGAELQWRAVRTATPDASTHWSAEELRELARRRLAAAR